MIFFSLLLALMSIGSATYGIISDNLIYVVYGIWAAIFSFGWINE